jgi:primosomal protein N' (replication factor Y)
VKLPKDGELIQRCKRFIQDQVAQLHNDKKFRNVVVIADVDAV